MYNTLNEKSKSCMKASAFVSLIVTMLLLSIALGALIYFGYEKFLNIYFLIAGIIIVISLFNIFVFTNIRYKRYKYLINEDRIEVIEGLFWITKTIIPIERLHQLVLKEGPLDKRYGLVNLKVFTASGNADISFISKCEIKSKILDRHFNLASGSISCLADINDSSFNL